MYQCLSLGMSYKVSQGNVLQLSPPLIINRIELNQAIMILDQALQTVSEQMGYQIHALPPENEAPAYEMHGTFSVNRQIGPDGEVIPSSTIPMEGVVSLKHPEINIHQVPLVIASPENFVKAGFGEIVTDFTQAEVDIVTWPKPGWRDVVPGTGNEGGITEGEFVFTHEGDMAVARNHAVDGHYITGWFTDPAEARFDRDYSLSSGRSRRQIYVREANYHPDGSQIFCPVDQTPFIALLALPGDDIQPEDFIAFYCDGSFGIKIHPGIWHQPLFPLAEKAIFNDKQGKVHACIAVDFVSEFSTYLSIPLPEQATR